VDTDDLDLDGVDGDEDTIPETPNYHKTPSGWAVYGLSQVKDCGGKQYVFIHYWFWHPSSTVGMGGVWGAGENATAAATKHEGDWECLMVVACLETDDPNTEKMEHTFGVCQPHSTPCSQHYYGQTLGWPGTEGDGYNYTIKSGTPGEDYMRVTGNRPIVWIAGGSHATYPNDRSYECHIGDNYDEESTYHIPPDPEWDESIDITTAAVGPNSAYPLVPLTRKIAMWQGHWGDENWDHGLPVYNTGPRSPRWRQSGTTYILICPAQWHDKFVKSNQDGDAGEPDVTLVP